MGEDYAEYAAYRAGFLQFHGGEPMTYEAWLAERMIDQIASERDLVEVGE